VVLSTKLVGSAKTLHFVQDDRRAVREDNLTITIRRFPTY